MSGIDRRAELQAERSAALAARLEGLLPPLGGDERALDVGAGLGALAFALAPRVREVVAIERDEAFVERLRASAPANVDARVGDGEHLDLPSYGFDLVGTMRTLHHTPRPELLVSELVRVTRPGGTLLVVDQLAPADPLAAVELNAFEQARDPSTSRVLSDQDLRGLFDANNLVLRRAEIVTESRDLDAYLDLVECEGSEREAVRAMAPSGYQAVIGWYVLSK
ncbi:MAG TPA: class I SAM-dependent methyltransferase [Gaiellaceae bacterium]|jgi:SAM-dependent methyltransferase